VVLVNRKLASAEVYGPWADSYVVAQMERQLGREPWVKTTDIKELRGLSVDDEGRLVRTAYL